MKEKNKPTRLAEELRRSRLEQQPDAKDEPPKADPARELAEQKSDYVLMAADGLRFVLKAMGYAKLLPRSILRSPLTPDQAQQPTPFGQC